MCIQFTVTANCKITSHSLKRSRPLWLVIMDNSAPTHKRRKLVKTYKYVIPKRQTLAAEVCGEIDSTKK